MSDIDLLLHAETLDDDYASLHAACALAVRLQARLDALYIADQPTAAFSLPEAVPMHLEEVRRRCDDAQHHAEPWRQRLAARGLAGSWRIAQGERVPLLCRAAAGYTWLIVERSRQFSDAPVGFGTASRCVFGSGRPVLVVPGGAEIRDVGARIVVAWNGSRESTLALTAALPALQRADEILVLDGSDGGADSSDPDRLANEQARTLPPPGLADWLQRRGVKARIEPFDAGPNQAAGPGVLNTAHAFRADLIVMGAWGRSRFSELVLGGTTRHLFMQSDVPMLVAR
jgi:nucleotide-binding universal stress UspA family protein